MKLQSYSVIQVPSTIVPLRIAGWEIVSYQRTVNATVLLRECI